MRQISNVINLVLFNLSPRILLHRAEIIINDASVLFVYQQTDSHTSRNFAKILDFLLNHEKEIGSFSDLFLKEERFGHFN